MSRKMLISLIVLMAVVLSGLILVQTTMIKSASNIWEEQFDKSVNNALDYVAYRLDLDEQELARQSAARGEMPGIEKHPNGIGNVFPRGSGVGSSFNLRLSYSEQGTNSSYREELSVSVLDTLNPGALTGIQNLMAQSMEQEERRRRWQNNTDWISYKYQLEDWPIEKRIDTTRLEQFLTSALAGNEINLQYKFAVFNSNLGRNSIILGDKTFNSKNRRVYSELLFQRDIDGPKPNYLNIYFPHRKQYLLKQTGLTIIPTVILTGLLIAIFTYTIMVIFRQKKLSMIKNDFINNMTHELKTPISTISLASQMLQDGTISNTPSTIEHVSRVINQESKRLSFQVEKVLQMAVFNEGRLKLKLRDFDINKMIETVTGNFELRVRTKNGKLITEIKAENAMFKGDEVHITNVIFNLLDNAMKYSKENPEITVATENRKDQVMISVQDNGIGIAKEHHAQIFDRFYRVPTGNVHDVKGFGLGLSYVKKIVDLHNGIIKVESALNKGTKFKIYFPQINN